MLAIVLLEIPDEFISRALLLGQLELLYALLFTNDLLDDRRGALYGSLDSGLDMLLGLLQSSVIVLDDGFDSLLLSSYIDDDWGSILALFLSDLFLALLLGHGNADSSDEDRDVLIGEEHFSINASTALDVETGINELVLDCGLSSDTDCLDDSLLGGNEFLLFCLLESQLSGLEELD